MFPDPAPSQMRMSKCTMGVHCALLSSCRCRALARNLLLLTLDVLLRCCGLNNIIITPAIMANARRALS
jgi:hypothetical protein